MNNSVAQKHNLPNISSHRLAVKQVKTTELKNYEKALDMLDDSIEEALQVIIDGLRSKDLFYKFRCAELLIRKVLPDKKVKQIVGENGGPVKIETTDRREAVVGIVKILDELGFDELRQRVENGSERILDAEYRTERVEEEEVERETGDDPRRERPRSDSSSTESVESVISSEAGQGEGQSDGTGEGSSRRDSRREKY